MSRTFCSSLYCNVCCCLKWHKKRLDPHKLVSLSTPLPLGSPSIQTLSGALPKARQTNRPKLYIVRPSGAKVDWDVCCKNNCYLMLNTSFDLSVPTHMHAVGPTSPATTRYLTWLPAHVPRAVYSRVWSWLCLWTLRPCNQACQYLNLRLGS